LLALIVFAVGFWPVFSPALRAQQCLPVPDGRVAWFTGDHMYDTIVAKNMSTATFIPSVDPTNLPTMAEGFLANGVAVVSGRVGKAFQFDGVDDRITVAHYTNLARTPAITAECWMRSTGPQLTTGNVTLLDKSHGFIDRSGWDLEVAVSSGRVVWTHGNIVANARDSLSGTSNVLDGQFHHLAATFDGTTIRVYVDGVQQASKNTSIALGANTRKLNIGHHFGGGDPPPTGSPGPHRHFKGIIDEATVYQRALSAAEILEIYAAAGKGKCVGAKQFQRQKLLPAVSIPQGGGGGPPSHFFGGSLTAQGDTLYALNPEGTVFNPINVVYLYKKSGTSWVFNQKIFPTSTSTDFGRSLAVDGDYLFIGSPTGGINSKVSFYRRSGTSWILETENLIVPASLSASPGGFGLTVDLDGTRAIVGSYGDDLTNDGIPGKGAAYIIERSSTGTWTIKQRIGPQSSGSSNGMGFGSSVAIDGSVALVGAPLDDQAGTDAGAVYVFELSGSTWTQTAKLLPWTPGLDGTFAFDKFGASVAYRNDIALVGAGHTDDVHFNGGAVYVLCRVGSSWIQEAKLFAMDGRLDDFFGSEKHVWNESRYIALNDAGDLAIIGARWAGGTNRLGPHPQEMGAAYFYRRELHDGEPVWTEKAKLLPNDGSSFGNFGSAMAMVEGAAFVGKPTGNSTASINGVYVFDLPVNRPPVANAGLDQVVDEGALVQLDGSASSDPDGDYLIFEWMQSSGPSVTLSDPMAVSPTFSAPLVNSGGATLVFQLIVSDGKTSSLGEITTVTIRNLNTVPVADAGLDQIAGEGSFVTLEGSNSFDEDGDPLIYLWLQTSGPPVALSDPAAAQPSFEAPFVGVGGELLTFELAVYDGIDVSAPDSVSIIVENINHSPIADAGPDQTVDEEQVVGLDGQNSNDPDTDPITFDWLQTAGPFVELSDPTSATPTFSAPTVIAGTETLMFELTVRDVLDASATDSVILTVRDVNAPPDCSLGRPSSGYLWPPNHKMIAITIVGVTDPNDDSVTITILGVRQDEPINGLGDGDTGPDAILQGNQVLLRAERSGLGNGRVYHLEFRADDGEGGWCTHVVTICVPHSMKKPIQCTDDGATFDSTQ